MQEEARQHKAMPGLHLRPSVPVFFVIFDFGSHMAMLRADSKPCAQQLLLVVFGRTIEDAGDRTTCCTIALVLS